MDSARSQPVVPGGALRPVGSDVCLVQGRVKTDLPQGTQVGRMVTAFHFITKKKGGANNTFVHAFLYYGKESYLILALTYTLGEGWGAVVPRL